MGIFHRFTRLKVLSVRVVHNAAPVEAFLQKDGKAPAQATFQRRVLLPGNYMKV